MEINMEKLIYTKDINSTLQRISELGGRVLHRFGDEAVVAEFASDTKEVDAMQQGSETSPHDLSAGVALAVQAYQDQRSAGEDSPPFGDGINWDAEGMDAPHQPLEDTEPTNEKSDLVDESSGTPTSLYLTGSVAVGIILVSSDKGAEKMSLSEQQKVIKEVYKGLDYLVKAEPRAQLSFTYDIRPVIISTPTGRDASIEDPYESYERGWRDAALAIMGYNSGRSGYRKYVQNLRSAKQTQWAYTAFFTKYELNHFAYAISEKVVMHYGNNGWGVDNIHRVFAHESCHIFGAADEYGNCSCDSLHGHLAVRNSNCRNCFPPGQQQECLMKGNTLELCQASRGQLGWVPSLFPTKPMT